MRHCFTHIEDDLIGVITSSQSVSFVSFPRSLMEEDMHRNIMTFLSWSKCENDIQDTLDRFICSNKVMHL